MGHDPKKNGKHCFISNMKLINFLKNNLFLEKKNFFTLFIIKIIFVDLCSNNIYSNFLWNSIESFLRYFEKYIETSGIK